MEKGIKGMDSFSAVWGRNLGQCDQDRSETPRQAFDSFFGRFGTESLEKGIKGLIPFQQAWGRNLGKCDQGIVQKRPPNKCC